MNIQIKGRRVSISDRYLQNVKREDFINEQTKALGWIAPQKELKEILGKAYDTAHASPKADNTKIEGE